MPLVVVTAPVGSGKRDCLSQMYHEYKRGVKAGYARIRDIPIWNLPLNIPSISRTGCYVDLKMSI